MPRIAVIGNVSRDRVNDGAPSPGGCPSFAALAFRLLGIEGEILTRFAEDDRALFEPYLAGLGVPVTALPARATSGFALDYDGEQRSMRIEAVGEQWTPADVGSLDARVGWVHVAPLMRSDFPPETLLALASPDRRVSFDGQGLVRVARVGPMQVDADFDPGLLRALSVLKLAEDEASVVADGGRFDARTAARLGVPEILVTLGSAGSIVYADGAEKHVPAAWPVLGVQTTGAGDAFMVAYGSARSDGADAVAAATFASELVARMLEERKRLASTS
jgi:sugar/nucleoside kinase (ribokinase family)